MMQSTVSAVPARTAEGTVGRSQAVSHLAACGWKFLKAYITPNRDDGDGDRLRNAEH
jgi:hypothetical protein